MLFTIEEENLMCIFDTSSRAALITGISAAAVNFDEPELIEIAETVLAKLGKMDDLEFSRLELYPEYDESEE